MRRGRHLGTSGGNTAVSKAIRTVGEAHVGNSEHDALLVRRPMCAEAAQDGAALGLRG